MNTRNKLASVATELHQVALAAPRIGSSESIDQNLDESNPDAPSFTMDEFVGDRGRIEYTVTVTARWVYFDD